MIRERYKFSPLTIRNGFTKYKKTRPDDVCLIVSVHWFSVSAPSFASGFGGFWVKKNYPKKDPNKRIHR